MQVMNMNVMISAFSSLITPKIRSLWFTFGFFLLSVRENSVRYLLDVVNG